MCIRDRYNVEVDAGWVDCSREALLYTMDPRNFLNEVRVFQFEEDVYKRQIFISSTNCRTNCKI